MDFDATLKKFNDLAVIEADGCKLLGAYTGICGPHTALYFPAGCVVLEQSLNNKQTIGLRTTVVAPSESAELNHLHGFLAKRGHDGAQRVKSYMDVCSKATPPRAHRSFWRQLAHICCIV